MKMQLRQSVENVLWPDEWTNTCDNTCGNDSSAWTCVVSDSHGSFRVSLSLVGLSIVNAGYRLYFIVHKKRTIYCQFLHNIAFGFSHRPLWFLFSSMTLSHLPGDKLWCFFFFFSIYLHKYSKGIHTTVHMKLK